MMMMTNEVCKVAKNTSGKYVYIVLFAVYFNGYFYVIQRIKNTCLHYYTVCSVNALLFFVLDEHGVFLPPYVCSIQIV